jgi:signal transduction histidine kinase
MSKVLKNLQLTTYLILFAALSIAQNPKLEKLWNEFENANHDTTRILLLIDRIGYLYQSIDSDSAIMYYQMAVSIADKALESEHSDETRQRILSLRATSTRYVGIVYQNIGLYSTAVDYFFKSLELAREIGDKKELSRAYNNLGIVQRRQGNLNEATEYYTQALIVTEEIGDLMGMAYAYNNLGVVLRLKGEYSNAIDLFSKSIDIRQKLGDRKGVSHVSNNIGNLYRILGEYDKAFQYYNRSLRIERELNDRNGIASVYESLADLNIAIADSSTRTLSRTEREDILRKAVDFAHKSFDISLDLGSYRRQNMASAHLKYAYRELGNFKKALEYAEIFITTSDSMFNEDKTKAIVEMQTRYETEKKQREIENHQLTIEKKVIESRRQKNQRNFFVVVFSLSLLSAFVILYGFIQKRKANTLLTQRAFEIETLNEELRSTVEELHSQRDNLEETLVNLQETQKQLVQSEKMASLGILTAGVAHEINNPLNFIKGGILAIDNLLRASLKDRYSEIEQMVEIVNIGIERTVAIVKSLSHYSRKDDQIKVETDVHPIIDNCLLMINNQIKNRVEVKKLYSSAPLIFNCNEGRMHQAILNILTNAYQAIQDKGTITINTEAANKHILISISDTGSGISKENLDKITDPFFTTKEPGKGTGLGLSIVQTIIEEHNGKLEFESMVGVGTTVLIKLPQS